MLSFHLLGPVSLHKDGQPLTQFRSQKEVALLIYLAHTGQTLSREFIADLLWEDRSNRQARSNLRTLLTRVRKHVDDAVDITRQSITIFPEHREVDAPHLLQTIASIEQLDAAKAVTLQEALSLYRGEFLADFVLSDAPQFEEWVVTTRRQIHREVLAAYHKLGRYIVTHGTVNDGIALAKRWLDADALDEAAHTLLIRLLLADGQTQTARTHYNYCTELLQNELGIAPPLAMRALIEAVHTKAARGQSESPGRIPETTILLDRPSTAKQLPQRSRHNLPAPHDQFFGRVAAQQEIAERLDQPWCRLVTIVGQGGVGKTRLAATVARHRLQHHTDGVWLVELAEIDPKDDDLVEAIAVEIATVLDLRLSGAKKPLQQLLEHLQYKKMLLVLDNFEHLLEEGVQLVIDLLAHCEQVQLMITSREALRIRAEWVIQLMGLDYAQDEAHTTYTDAVTLFAARVAQARRAALNPTELATAQEICRLVEGLPLAIELAASLTTAQPVQDIADELSHGFNTLATTLRDVPRRHRNLQIVFAMSWQMLSNRLQRQLAALAFFRGGFTKDAAKQVADATEADLAQLAEKSLLALDNAAERYALHPVIRAFAAAKSTAPDATLQSHATYFLQELAAARKPLQTATPQHAMAMLMPDLENIRLAWQTDLALRRADRLVAALPALSIVYQLRGLSHQAETTMEVTLHATKTWGKTGVTLASHAGLERARFQNRLGRYHAAMETVETALRHAAQCGDHWAEGMGHVLWGESLWRLGEYRAAQTKLNHALTIADDMGDGSERTVLTGWAHHHLGVIDDIQGRHATALDHLEEACAAWRAIDNMQALSNSLNSVGLVFYHQGDLSVAKRTMEEALALCNQLDNRHLQALMLNNLSILSIEQSDYLSAHHYLQLGLESATSSGNLTSQGEIYSSLGKNYYLLGKPDLAVEHLQKGLQISESTGNRTLMATIMLTLANTERRKDDVKRVESLYIEALRIARQDNLQHIECEALIGMAELLSKRDDRRAHHYSEQAVTVAKAIQNPDLLKRAHAIAHYSSVSVDIDTNLPR